MNAQNVVMLIGRIPNTDKIKYEYAKESSRLNGFISVRRSYKKKGEQYYKEDLLKFVAFGPTANYLGDYVNKGDTISLTGSLEVSDNWVDENNITHYGQPYIKVDAATKIYDTVSNNNNVTSVSESISKNTVIANPLAAAKAKQRRDVII